MVCIAVSIYASRRFLINGMFVYTTKVYSPARTATMQKKMINPFLRFEAFFFCFALRTLSSAEDGTARSRTVSGCTYTVSLSAVFLSTGLALPGEALVCLVDFELNTFMEASFFLFVLTL